MASSTFKRIGSLVPGKSVHDLSYTKQFDCDMGQLIPVYDEEVVPGDSFRIQNEIVVRFHPLVAPILHQVNVYTHYWFVPYRLLWKDWEKFITKGVDGMYDGEHPKWIPSAGKNGLYSLWDYFGHPVDIMPTGLYPVPWQKRAYNMIFNEYYRDNNLQEPIGYDEQTEEIDLDANEDVLNRNWEKDYFTAALESQQRGPAPAIPISGLIGVNFQGSLPYILPTQSVTSNRVLNTSGTGSPYAVTSTTSGAISFSATAAQIPEGFRQWLNQNSIDLSEAITFNVADLRLAFQLQKWLERNARGGVRYTEFLRAHFNVAPRDERLDRPEYIGGSKSPVIISEVLQTSSSDEVTPQGNMAGHGISADRTFVGKYFVQEYGIIVGIMSIMPRPMYTQGVDRRWIKETPYDYYFREFANLSEQPIFKGELVATNDENHNKDIFGWIGRYDEMRVRRNMAVGAMRGTLSYWNLSRKFDVNSPPALNEEFIKCNQAELKRIFAHGTTAPGLIVNYANIVRAVRPMPISGEPGLIDHF